MLFMQFNTFTCSYLLYKNNGDNHTLVCGYIIVQIFKLTSWNMQFVDSSELINIHFRFAHLFSLEILTFIQYSFV